MNERMNEKTQTQELARSSQRACRFPGFSLKTTEVQKMAPTYFSLKTGRMALCSRPLLISRSASPLLLPRRWYSLALTRLPSMTKLVMDNDSPINWELTYKSFAAPKRSQPLTNSLLFSIPLQKRTLAQLQY